MTASVVDQLEVIQIQHQNRDFMPLIGFVVAPERQTVPDSGKRIDIGHIVQVLDIDIQIHDELFEGCRKNADFVLLIIIQLGIIVTFADLLRSFCQFLKRTCDSPCEGHDKNDKDDQQRSKDNRNFCDPFLPGGIDLLNGNRNIQAHPIA